MGFKDRIRNHLNTEHASLEEYQKAVEERYQASRTHTPEVPNPAIKEPAKELTPSSEDSTPNEAPGFVKSRKLEVKPLHEPAIVEEKEEEEVEAKKKKEEEPTIVKTASKSEKVEPVDEVVDLHKTETKKPSTKKKETSNT